MLVVGVVVEGSAVLGLWGWLDVTEPDAEGRMRRLGAALRVMACVAR